ncbi:MAG: hypothetical protein CBB60_004675 [Armatimonadetes bacterium Cent15-Ar3]|nr:MAG: hypothetical protein CBB60_004675 [Armatimonadetes bacterium Cent15-Ar3]
MKLRQPEDWGDEAITRWSSAAARRAFEEDRLQEWIEEYLQVPKWENLGLLRRVRAYSVEWPAPELVLLDRCDPISGPSPSLMFPKNIQSWERDVLAILERGIDVDLMPPLLVWVKPDCRLNLADGNHRVAAAKRLGITKLWALVHPTPLVG